MTASCVSRITLFPSVWVLAACALPHMAGQPAAASYPPRSGEVCAGVGRADLTLAPGVSTFGFGPESRVADGFWTRNYCRAFYFHQPFDGASSSDPCAHRAVSPTERGADTLVLISCDLQSIDAVLQRKVAAEVATIVPAARLMLTATHTHGGPGHYFSAANYASIGSQRLPGFDPSVLEFFVQHIAQAVRDAHAAARPARLTWRHAENFWGFSRNRVLPAFLRNWPGAALSPSTLFLSMPFPSTTNCSSLDDAALRTPNVACPPLTDPSLLAVDPTLHVLRVDAVDAKGQRVGPLGSISFFAVHPNVLGTANRLLSGDLHGVISRLVEARLRTEAVRGAPPTTDPLHAIVNTNEGDMAPVQLQADVSETRRLGQRIGDLIYKTHPPALPSFGPDALPPAASTLGAIYVETDLRAASIQEAGRSAQLCPAGEVGEGTVRGSTDHVTTFTALPWFDREPTNWQRSGTYGACQRPKREMLDLLSVITRPYGKLPSHVAFAVWLVDDTLIAFVPAELTLAAGVHMRRDVLDAAHAASPTPPQHAIVAGLANAYVQYVATRPEYDVQGYEGSSTLYGPESSEFFALQARRLTRLLMAGEVPAAHTAEDRDLAQRYDYDPGPEVPRRARPTKAVRCDPRWGAQTCLPRVAPRPPRSFVSWCRVPSPRSDGPDIPNVCMIWRDRGPGDVLLERAPWVSLREATPTRPAFVSKSAAAPIDDTGDLFVTRAHDQQHTERGDYASVWLWSTLFAPEADVWGEMSKSRLVLRVAGPADDGLVESPAFTAHTLAELPQCSVELTRACSEGGTLAHEVYERAVTQRAH